MCRLFSGGGAPGLVGGLLRALARGLGHVEGVLSGMQTQPLEGLEDVAGRGRCRGSRRLRPPLLLRPGRSAPAVLGGEGRGDRDRQRKSHDDIALGRHVPGDVSAGAPSLASSSAGAYGPPPCRSAASCVPAVRSPSPSRRAWWFVSRASCAIRSSIPTGRRTST